MKLEAPQWFFAWSTGWPYITGICGWTRKDVIRCVENLNGERWRNIYVRGGRVIRCDVRPCKELKP